MKHFFITIALFTIGFEAKSKDLPPPPVADIPFSSAKGEAACFKPLGKETSDNGNDLKLCIYKIKFSNKLLIKYMEVLEGEERNELLKLKYCKESKIHVKQLKNTPGVLTITYNCALKKQGTVIPTGTLILTANYNNKNPLRSVPHKIEIINNDSKSIFSSNLEPWPKTKKDYDTSKNPIASLNFFPKYKNGTCYNSEIILNKAQKEDPLIVKYDPENPDKLCIKTFDTAGNTIDIFHKTKILSTGNRWQIPVHEGCTKDQLKIKQNINAAATLEVSYLCPDNLYGPKPVIISAAYNLVFPPPFTPNKLTTIESDGRSSSYILSVPMNEAKFPTKN